MKRLRKIVKLRILVYKILLNIGCSTIHRILLLNENCLEILK